MTERGAPGPAPVLATVGYEGATPAALLAALQAAGVTLLADVRAVVSSRRPGFSKTPLSAALAAAGIAYVHLRGLGTPPDGRAAARAGRFAAMRDIYAAHLDTPAAQADLARLEARLDTDRVCVLCFEADPRHCHRSVLAEALAARRPLDVVHLRPEIAGAD